MDKNLSKKWVREPSHDSCYENECQQEMNNNYKNKDYGTVKRQII